MRAFIKGWGNYYWEDGTAFIIDWSTSQKIGWTPDVPNFVAEHSIPTIAMPGQDWQDSLVQWGLSPEKPMSGLTIQELEFLWAQNPSPIPIKPTNFAPWVIGGVIGIGFLTFIKRRRRS